MAYYDALKTAWNNPTQPPPGVSGQALTGGMTTDQKINAVNAWTVVGPAVPAMVRVTDVIGAIVPADFLALTSLQIQQLQFLAQGGDSVYAPPNGTVRQVFASIFSGKTTTINNMLAILNTYDKPNILWWGAPATGGGGGLNSPVSREDTTLAGLV